jgi:hypothetical protein
MILSLLPNYRDCLLFFSAAHAFQRLLILLASKTFHLHREITQNIALVGTSPLKTTDDLSLFIKDHIALHPGHHY